MTMPLDGTEDLVGTGPSVHDRLAEVARMNRLGQTRGTGSPLIEDIHRGVTVSWLSQAFDMDPKTVKQRLGDCPAMTKRKAGYIYDLKIAARYLVPPAISITQFIKTMKPTDLPAHMQMSYWDAALKRQKWEEQAGMLFRADAVREVFAKTFMTIKSAMQLFPDTIERNNEITQIQRETLITLLDDLQNEIYKALIADTASSATMPQLAELPTMTGEVDVEDDLEAMDLV